MPVKIIGPQDYGRLTKIPAADIMPLVLSLSIMCLL